MQLGARCPHGTGRDKSFAEQRSGQYLVGEDLLEMNFKRTVACQQIVQVAVEKTELPDLLEQQVQKQPDVIDVGLSVARYGEYCFCLLYTSRCV